MENGIIHYDYEAKTLTGNTYTSFRITSHLFCISVFIWFLPVSFHVPRYPGED